MGRARRASGFDHGGIELGPGVSLQLAEGFPSGHGPRHGLAHGNGERAGVTLDRPEELISVADSLTSARSMPSCRRASSRTPSTQPPPSKSWRPASVARCGWGSLGSRFSSAMARSASSSAESTQVLLYPPALSDVAEHHHRAHDGPLLPNRSADVLDGQARSLLAPEDLVLRRAASCRPRVPMDRALLARERRAVGVGVVDQVVPRAAGQLLDLPPHHARRVSASFSAVVPRPVT